MTVEYEALNQTAPLANSTGMRCIANLLVGPQVSSADLAILFPEAASGHYYTIQADGAKVYVAFAPGQGNSGYSTGAAIDERAEQGATGACWPVPDGTQLPVRLLGGAVTPTGGVPTRALYSQLVYKTATGGSSGYLRVYRSSVGPGQGLEAFGTV